MSGTKVDKTKHVSVRVPIAVFADYMEFAEARGMDLSAVLNWVLAEHRPEIVALNAKHAAAMREATGQKEPG